MFSYSFFFQPDTFSMSTGKNTAVQIVPYYGMHFVHTFLFMFPKVMIGRLFENQELLKLMIIYFILKTFTFDLRMIL